MPRWVYVLAAATAAAAIPCPSLDCGGRGSCDETTGACFCEKGWFGRNCEMQQPECNLKVCNGRGVCVHGHLDGVLRCDCNPNCGYTGADCLNCPSNARCTPSFGPCPFVDIPREPAAVDEDEGMPPVMIFGVVASVVFVIVVAVYVGKKLAKWHAERKAGREGGVGDAEDQAMTGVVPRQQHGGGAADYGHGGEGALQSKLKRGTSVKGGGVRHGSSARAMGDGAYAPRVRFDEDAPSVAMDAVIKSPAEPRCAGDELEIGPDGKWTRARSAHDNPVGNGGAPGSDGHRRASQLTAPLASDVTLSSAVPTHDHPLQQYAREELQEVEDMQYSEPDADDATVDPELHLTFRTNRTMESCRSQMYPPYQTPGERERERGRGQGSPPHEGGGEGEPATAAAPTTLGTPGLAVAVDLDAVEADAALKSPLSEHSSAATPKSPATP